MHIHETILWVDASVRMQTSNLEHVYAQATNNSRGVVTFDHCGHNIFMATHAQMYRYLPITKDSAVNSEMFGASVVFICRSKQVGNASIFYLGSNGWQPMTCITEEPTSRRIQNVLLQFACSIFTLSFKGFLNFVIAHV